MIIYNQKRDSLITFNGVISIKENNSYEVLYKKYGNKVKQETINADVSKLKNTNIDCQIRNSESGPMLYVKGYCIMHDNMILGEYPDIATCQAIFDNIIADFSYDASHISVFYMPTINEKGDLVYAV